MRLIKYLTLAVAMSRNQAGYFIRKKRVSVDGKIISDPDNEKLCSDILLDVNDLCSKFPIYKH